MTILPFRTLPVAAALPLSLLRRVPFLLPLVLFVATWTQSPELVGAGLLTRTAFRAGRLGAGS